MEGVHRGRSDPSQPACRAPGAESGAEPDPGAEPARRSLAAEPDPAAERPRRARSVDLTGRGAIVTGGAAGMGRGIANRLAGAGAGVVIAGVNTETAKAVACARHRPRGALARLLAPSIGCYSWLLRCDGRRILAMIPVPR